MIYLDVVEVGGLRNSKLGLNQENIDSTDLQDYQTQNLAEVLDQHAGIYIKSYGLGSLATSSVRGASAKQSVVLWNGLSIQNPMLGLIDLSLIPIPIIEKVSLTKGGNASMWGSGVGGGIFSINNEQSNEAGFVGNIGLSAGSFATYKGHAKLAYSKRKISLVVKPFYQQAQNDFEYTYISEKRNQEHASLLNYGALSELYFNANETNQFIFRHWYQKTERQIPASLTTSASEAEQDDQISRYTFNWIYKKGKTTVKSRSAYFDEDNYFEDAKINLEALNTFQSLINEIEVSQKISENHSALVGLNHTHYKANAEAYQQQRKENRFALFLAYRLSKNKLGIEAGMRMEMQDSNLSPLTPSLSTTYNLTKSIQLNGRINRIYNLPTLNDRYWIPGGNIDLEAESGWNQELGFNINYNLMSFSAYYYHRTIKNQIVWQPGLNFWSPINLNSSISDGLEFDLKTTIKLNNFNIGLHALYEYVVSIGENSKQLIYIPRHQAKFGINVNYKDFDLAYRHRFVDKVYTLTDNSSFLKGYQLAYLKLGYHFNLKNKRAKAFLNLNNIWNKSYQVILSRPMPGIHLETGVNIPF